MYRFISNLVWFWLMVKLVVSLLSILVIISFIVLIMKVSLVSS